MWVERFTRRRRLLPTCLLVIGGCLATTSLGAPAPSASASGGVAAVKAVACTDPVVHDSYDGFHIGVPAGWYLSSLSGLIVVFKDYSATTEGVVQTAFVNKNESQSAFLSRILAAFSKNAKSAGNVLTFRLSSPTTAVASGHVGNIVIAGEARVSFMPTVTAHGSELGVVSGYWAPSSQLGAERAKLASIGGCFGLQAGTLSRFVKDQWFGYTLPLGWKVGNEGPDELFLDAGPNASANFLLAGPFLASSTGVTDAASFQQYCFQRLGLTINTVLSSATFPSQTTAAGGTEQEIITEFLGTAGSKQVHGLVRTIASTGGGVTSGVLRIALATPSTVGLPERRTDLGHLQHRAQLHSGPRSDPAAAGAARKLLPTGRRLRPSPEQHRPRRGSRYRTGVRSPLHRLQPERSRRPRLLHGLTGRRDQAQDHHAPVMQPAQRLLLAPVPGIRRSPTPSLLLAV